MGFGISPPCAGGKSIGAAAESVMFMLFNVIVVLIRFFRWLYWRRRTLHFDEARLCQLGSDQLHLVNKVNCARGTHNQSRDDVTFACELSWWRGLVHPGYR